MASPKGDSERSVFVCYSRADQSTMRWVVEQLEENGIRSWVDEVIEPGSNWRDELSEAIANADLVLFLLSESSAASKICFQEIDFALDCETAILVAALGALEIPPKLAFRLGSQQQISIPENHDALAAQQMIAAVQSVLDRREMPPAAAASIVRNDAIGEISVAIGLLDSAAEGLSRSFVSAISRYISWNGGPFRAIRLRDGMTTSDGYQLDVSLQIDETASVAWELTDQSSQQVIWSHLHNEAADAFSPKRSRIAEMIAEGVIGEIRRHRLSQADDPDRLSYWDLVLTADHFQRLESKTIERQRSCLEIAIARFPALAPGHAVKANFAAWERLNGIGAEPGVLAELARNEASAALELDSRNPYVLVCCGSAYSRLGDYERGARLCRRAYSIAPTNASKEALARSLCFAGEPDEAINLFFEMLETMPAGQVFQSAKLVVPLIQANRLEEALEFSSKCVVDFPKEHFGLMLHANLLALFEDERAAGVLEQARKLMPDTPWNIVLAATERTYGRTADQRRLLTGGIRRLLDESR